MPFTEEGVGWRVHATSEAAARKVKGGTLRLIVLRMMADNGGTMTRTEVEHAAPTKVWARSLPKRFSELEDRGLVYNTGETRVSEETNRPQIVWGLTELGRDFCNLV